jgi:hypothetical protein
MERIAADDRLIEHLGTLGYDDLHAYLYRCRWLRCPIRNCHADGRRAECVAQRKPGQRRERRYFDIELVFEQRHLLHGIGRMVGRSGDQRLGFNWRSERDDNLCAGMHRSGRQYHPERDGNGHRRFDRNGNFVVDSANH